MTRPILWGNCLGMIAFIVVVVIGTMVFINYYTRHDENIKVPNLTGLTQEAAEKKLEELGLHLQVTDTGYVRTKGAGVILLQETAAGKEVKEGRIINVTINSLNSPTIALPDLADNCSLAEAKARLAAIGIKIGPVEYIIGEKGWVYDIKLRGRVVTAGTRIPVDQAVTIVVGDGGTDEYDQYGEDEEELYSGDGSYDSGNFSDDEEEGDNYLSDKDYIIQEMMRYER